jgi:class 3 adenylate cyclase
MIAVLRQQSTILMDAVTLDLADAMITAHTADAGAGAHAIDAALTHDLERYSRNWGGAGMAMCCTLADAAALVDHRRAGERLLPIVATVADRNVVLGMPPPVAFGWGSHYLGVCQLLVGAVDDAAQSLADALEHNAAMGALPFVARTRLALARVALARDDGDGAVAHAAVARDIAERAGLAAALREADAALVALGGSGAGAAGDVTTTTFVFTDIVGSTAGTAAAGDKAWRESLDAHASHLRALAVRNGGRVVKGLGDGFMLVFPSARAGVDFAVALQRDVGGRPFVLRVGVHTGEAEVVGDDYIGHHVNLAARVSGAAGDGEVLVSDVVHTILSGARDIEWGEPRATHLKGIPGTQVLYPVKA